MEKTINPEPLDIDSVEEKPKGRVFTETQLMIGTFFGGPLATTYFFAQNFKVFKEERKARNSWIIVILFSIFLIALLLLLSENKIVNRVAPLAYTLIGIFIFKSTQEDKVNTHFSESGKKQNWGKYEQLVNSISTLVCFIPTPNISPNTLLPLYTYCCAA